MVAERLRDLMHQHSVPYRDLVFVEKPPLRQFTARQAYGEERLIVRCADFGTETPEYARMLAMVTYLHAKWKGRAVDHLHELCDHPSVGVDGFCDLATPTVLPPSVSDYLDCRASVVIRMYDADKVLEYKIKIDRDWGQVPADEWYDDVHGDHMALYCEDVTVRSFHSHNCRRAATILMSYKLRKFIPQRDLRVFLGAMVYKTARQHQWRMWGLPMAKQARIDSGNIDE